MSRASVVHLTFGACLGLRRALSEKTQPLRAGAAKGFDHLPAEPWVEPDVRAVAHPRDELHRAFERQVPGLKSGDDHAERAFDPGGDLGRSEIQPCCLAGREIVEQRPIRLQLDGEENGLLLAAAEKSGIGSELGCGIASFRWPAWKASSRCRASAAPRSRPMRIASSWTAGGTERGDGVGRGLRDRRSCPGR